MGQKIKFKGLKAAVSKSKKETKAAAGYNGLRCFAGLATVCRGGQHYQERSVLPHSCTPGKRSRGDTSQAVETVDKGSQEL